jgi:acyl-CoA reductase-like NAD-dependent aldehyde dehydrogenase
MSDFTMTIDGKQVSSYEWISVEDPATGTEFGRVPHCRVDHLDAAMTAAQIAQVEWARDDHFRQEALRRCAATLVANMDRIAGLLTAEQGKPFKEARRETAAAAAWFQYYADLDLPDIVVQDDASARITVDRRPLGVVAAITPWNFPVMLASWKLAPALRAGNSVVLKPSAFTPLTALLVGELLADELPPGLLNVVTGPDELGAWITQHRVPRKISFTGSTATGIKVATAAAATLKHVTLELGGNDAAIVLDDCDPDTIADKLFWSAFINNGQACVAIKRLYVPESSYDKYVDALAAVADAKKVGAGMEPDTKLGPINNRPQFDRVVGLIDDALARGGRVAAGGAALDRPGNFYRPTILADVPDDARVVVEEQFGPALPILPYTSIDDAVARANHSQFGLAGSVWGTDEDRAQSVAARLECGVAWVNTHAAPSMVAPFTGTKYSGLGVENGPWGLEEFVELRTSHLHRG